MIPFGNPIHEKVNGEDMEFPKLFVEDYATLFSLRRNFEKEKIEQAEKEGFITKEDTKKMLLAIATAPENIFDLQNCTGDPKVAKAILWISWSKTKRTKDEFNAFIKGEDPEFLANLAFRVTKKEEEPKDDGKNNGNQKKTGGTDHSP